MPRVEQALIKKRAEFLGRAYKAGSDAYENNPVARKEINKINNMIYDYYSEQYYGKINWKIRKLFHKYIRMRILAPLGWYKFTAMLYRYKILK